MTCESYKETKAKVVPLSQYSLIPIKHKLYLYIIPDA